MKEEFLLITVADNTNAAELIERIKKALEAECPKLIFATDSTVNAENIDARIKCAVLSGGVSAISKNGKAVLVGTVLPAALPANSMDAFDTIEHAIAALAPQEKPVYPPSSLY